MTNLFETILLKRKFILMAEIKIKSPADGILGNIDDVEKIAMEYMRGGTDVISVVVESKYFGGNPEMIARVKKTVSLPVFAKDFVTIESQVEKSKNAGADAILLLANLVSKEKMITLYKKTENLGITAVVEVDSEDSAETAIFEKYPVIAENARNLRNFSINRKKAKEIIKMIPRNRVALAFSGVRNKEDVSEYLNTGARGVLIGTTLMKTDKKADFLSGVRDL